MNGSTMDGNDTVKKQDVNREPETKKPNRIIIYIAIAVIVLCVIVAIVLAVTLKSRSKDDCPEGIHCDWRSVPRSDFLKDQRCDPLCTTRPCIRSAEYVLSGIDSSKDPCDDFYGFACGAYEEQAVIFPEQSDGVFIYQEMEDELLLNLKDTIESVKLKSEKNSLSYRLMTSLYDDCMNTDHHKDVMTKEIWKELFGENGRLPWPLINEKSSNDQKHFVKMMSGSLFYNVNPFFRHLPPSVVTINKKDWLIIRFTQSEDIEFLQSIHEESNLDDDESVLARYSFALVKILTEVGLDLDRLKDVFPKILDVENSFIKEASKAVESIEKVYTDNPDLYNEHLNYTCQDLNRTMGNIKWCKLVQQLRKQYGLPEEHDIQIELPTLKNYFSAVNRVLGNFSESDIMNYIGVKFIMGFLKYMPSPLRDIYYREKDLFPVRRVVPHWTLSSRWQQCTEVVLEFMWLPLEMEYQKEKMDEGTRAKVRKIANSIKDTYLSVADKMSWLKKALGGKDPKKRIRDMDIIVGRKSELSGINTTILDQFYSFGYQEEGEKIVNHPLIRDVLHIEEFYTRIPYVIDLDYGYALVERPLFNIVRRYFELGTIQIPYGLLTLPFFLPGRPMYMEYAALGSKIFWSISQSLLVAVEDDNASLNAYNNAASCTWEQIHLYKTGRTKLKENKVDDDRKFLFGLLTTLGMHGSFQAYMDYVKENGHDKGLPGLPFTNEQLFFISAAQTHCEKFTEDGNFAWPFYIPGRVRVNMPLANLKEFSETFRCPVGASMNPKRKCCILGNGMLSHDCK